MSRLGLSPGISFWQRKNSIGFDVDDIGGVRRLRMEDFVNFLLNDVKVLPTDVEKLQIHPLAPYCFVGLPSKEKMEEVWARIKEGVVWSGKGLVHPFLCEDRYTEVKIKGCNYLTDEAELEAQMGHYGEILSCKEYRTRIKGIGGQQGGGTGDFMLKMKLKMPIPRLLPIAHEGELWVAYYEGQEDVCWKCFLPGHFTRACTNPDQGPRSFARNQKDARGYANAVADASDPMDEHIEDTVDDDVGAQPAAEQVGGDVGVQPVGALDEDAVDDDVGEQLVAAQVGGGAGVRPAGALVEDIETQPVGSDGNIQEHSLNLRLSSTPIVRGGQELDEPGRPVISDPLLRPAIQVVPSTQSQSEDDMFIGDSQDERAAVEAADLNSALANEDDMENFGYSPLDLEFRKDKKAEKKERQRDKRLHSGTSTDGAPKRNRSASGSLEQSPIGSQRDKRRGSSGNLNPVALPRPVTTPAQRNASIARGTKQTATTSRPGSSKGARVPPLLKK